MIVLLFVHTLNYETNLYCLNDLYTHIPEARCSVHSYFRTKIFCTLIFRDWRGLYTHIPGLRSSVHSYSRTKMFCTLIFRDWDVLYTHIPGLRCSVHSHSRTEMFCILIFQDRCSVHSYSRTEMFCTLIFHDQDILYTHISGVRCSVHSCSRGEMFCTLIPEERRSMPQSFTKFPDVNQTSSQKPFKHLRSLLEFRSAKSGKYTKAWHTVDHISVLLICCQHVTCSAAPVTCLYISQHSEDQLMNLTSTVVVISSIINTVISGSSLLVVVSPCFPQSTYVSSASLNVLLL